VNIWNFSADTGGTFTDCLAEGPDGLIRRGKVLSSGRLRTTITGRDGEALTIQPLPVPDTDWLKGRPVWIQGKPSGIIRQVDAGHLVLEKAPVQMTPGDILEIDTGLEAPVLAMRLLVPEAAQPGQSLSFRLGTTKGTNALLEKKGAPVALFLTHGFEDLLLIRDQKRPHLFERHIQRDEPLYQQVYAIAGRLDTNGREQEPLDAAQLADAARAALAGGATVAAVCFLNSWKNPAHEEQALEILHKSGFSTVSASSSIRPLIKYLDRADTTLVNATLSPVLDAYLDHVESGIHGNSLSVMTSAGGLVSRERFHAVDSLVSGPAGGVLGTVAAGRQAGMDKIIGLDMGGTSTDVSRWKDQLELRQQIQVGEARILTPAMPIETVAAGGGSICGYREGRLFVGPESAGADPGPASYGAGGPLCLTDIHLLLGRIDPEGFSIPIRMEHARARLDEVMTAADESDWEALAEGFLTLATERMTHAIRQVTLRDGEDPAEYGLVAFGGAGGLHACRVAGELGIQRVLFPADAGILSAKGIHRAPMEAVHEEQLFMEVGRDIQGLEHAFQRLHERAARDLAADGVKSGQLEEPVRTVYVRIAGQETGIPVRWNVHTDIGVAFEKQFVANFGYFPRSPVLEVIKVRLRLLERKPPDDLEIFRDVAIAGPHIISDPFGTCFVEQGWEACKGDAGGYELRRSESVATTSTRELETVRKALVMNRLEGLVEEMGDQLQRTALSTNIRERLDFSCALLDRQGRLLVNAPHIPVHLGAMGLCVRECMKRLDIGPGDVIVTNHPAFGGSHLPDVTLVTGLFAGDNTLLGFLANRAHHAEWGGRTPGSMPADATSLLEEGVIIEPQYLICKGKDCFDRIEELLSRSPYPSRLIRENRIDLEAQLASLQRGRQLFQGLLADFGGDAVGTYFQAFYDAASDALVDALRRAGSINGEAVEQMDDGHRIQVKMRGSDGALSIDFKGTSGMHPGNLNATPAIVRSAVLYVLRLFVDTAMPLNEGLLDKVEISLPECFLNPVFPDDPAHCPAVVGGNVETSQRLVDTLIGALGIMAAGQGTMNNFLFGNERFGYYETIGGGAGAGDGFAGASGVHVHMTNTAITDPEILEQRFPVHCSEFSLRKGSRGKGTHDGGDGLVREIRFEEPVSVSLLTQNRTQGAKGLAGGGCGVAGSQWHLLSDGTRIPLPGVVQVDVAAGESIRIETPGGGGWGPPAQKDKLS
jgi:5-oxoprolinase (ATP-hydrolysing)